MQNRFARRCGFSLVELLIVIGIITLLISILVPVVSRVRQAGYVAASQALITQLSQAVTAYEQDFRAFPGPLSNTEIYNSNPSPIPTPIVVDPDPAVAAAYATTLDQKKITMSENLVLGLLGGLKRMPPPGSQLYYDPRLIGGGPFSLLSGGVTKRYKNYAETEKLSWRGTEPPSPIDGPTPDLKTGRFRDNANFADDTIIPEFVDAFPDALPVLYLRAKKGASAQPGSLDAKNNTIITYDSADPNNRVGQYDLHQIEAYTKAQIGGGRKKITPIGWSSNPNQIHGLFPDATKPVDEKSAMAPDITGTTYRYPLDAYVYFRNAALSTPKESDPAYGAATNRNDVPHQKDGFILISAGADRVYGTRDDLTNFGGIGQ